MPITLQQAADKLDAVASDFGAFVTWAQGTPTGGPFGDGRYRLGVALDAPALACPAAWQAGYASQPRLAALGNLAVVSATTTAQPASPADGAVYILPAGKSGAAWGAMATGALAYYRDGAWEAISPLKGWQAYVQDSDQIQVYTGTAWSQSAARGALSLGSAAIANTGTSGAAIPLLNGANSWSALQTFNGALSCGAVGGARVFVFTNASANSGFGVDLSGAGRELSLFAGGPDDVNGRISFGRRRSDTGVYVEHASIVLGTGAWSTREISPLADNASALGQAARRWTTVFAATGAINTSDAREKTPIFPLGEALRRAAIRIKAGIGTFQWLEAVERKGTDKARIHIGVTAQAVEEAFAAEGLEAGRYALFCEDALTEEVEIEPPRFDASGEIESPGRYETRPILEPDGTSKTRKGVRADQLFWLLLA